MARFTVNTLRCERTTFVSEMYVPDPIGSACGIDYTVKKLSTMVGNLASSLLLVSGSQTTIFSY